jgi:hypothetical protein
LSLNSDTYGTYTSAFALQEEKKIAILSLSPNYLWYLKVVLSLLISPKEIMSLSKLTNLISSIVPNTVDSDLGEGQVLGLALHLLGLDCLLAGLVQGVQVVHAVHPGLLLHIGAHSRYRDKLGNQCCGG